MKQALKKIWHYQFIRSPSEVLGLMLCLTMPSRIKKVKKSLMIDYPGQSWIDFFIKTELNFRFYNQSDEAIRMQNRKDYWGSKYSKKWHEYHEEKITKGDLSRMKLKFILLEKISELTGLSVRSIGYAERRLSDKADMIMEAADYG